MKGRRGGLKEEWRGLKREHSIIVGFFTCSAFSPEMEPDDNFLLWCFNRTMIPLEGRLLKSEWENHPTQEDVKTGKSHKINSSSEFRTYP